MALPIVAIVGRPNVGKSTLFNKLIGKRLSIVDDTPGVTRDRIYSKCEWLGREFMLVDTGGIEPKSSDSILAQMRRQAEIAIDRACVIILVTDLRCGVTATDYDVASMLQKSGKPVILCVNKCDRLGEPSPEFYEFYNLGLGDPVEVSSVHGYGTGDLLDRVLECIPDDALAEEEKSIRVAVIGKPNVGKSSLINRIAGEDRAIVSDIAGTTRDATDTEIENEWGRYVFVDTAGIRKKSKVYENIEHYSVLRSYMAVDESDVCVIIIDASVGFTEQDSKVAGYAHEQGKGCVIAVNKWDVVEKDGEVLLDRTQEAEEKTDDTVDRSRLTVKDILDFADQVRMEDIEEVISRQIRLNTAISQEGLDNNYGAQIGKTLMHVWGKSATTRACARAAAGSDARMGGCSMPVVINSGSGNQGITVSLPVIVYAEEWEVSRDKLYRSLVVSNLIAVHQKYYIGSLSAYCGAVSAGCGAGCSP